ncbi:MAG: hypothetical protein HA496_10945 [Thaumarchaeota archaeon]|nr:hypothetical protein [Nitrososphaerota archaeon]
MLGCECVTGRSQTVPTGSWGRGTWTLPGGWIGSTADEGRGKRRYAPGRSMHPLIRGSLNG